MPGLPNIFDVPFGEETTWFVSHVDEGSGLFYVQHGNPSVTAKYERLFCTIEQDASEGALRRLESPKIGKLCLAQYSVDEQWYRARILSCNGEVVEVIFLDYGNSEQTLKDSLCELPEEYKVLPAQCCQANLNCFAPIPGNHWTKEAIQLLKELVLDKELRGKAIRLSKNGTLHMSLFADNANKVKVSEQLVAAGYGRSLPPTSSRSNSSSSLSSLSSCDTGKGNPNVTQHYALQELDTEDYHDLCISHYESLDSFYCQLEKISSKLEQLTCKLNTYYNSLSPDELVLQEPLKGMPCCALYFEDQIWYRGIITNTDFLDRGTVTVSFIDFGNTDETPVKHVKCIKPEFMDLPAQGIQCGLLGIKPPQNLGDYSHAAMEVFEKMTSDKHLIGLASGKREGPKYLIILYDTTSGKEEVNINDELVKAGVAWKAEAKDASTSSSEENTSACEKTLLSSPAITLDIGRTVVGYVAYTLDPHEFYFQLSKDTELLEDIMEKLDSLYSSQEHGTRTNISVGSVCCCRYQEDGKFYRAQVVSYSEATAKVIYIDYGNAEDASIADLFPLSKEFLQYPGLAIKCKLDGVAPINGLFDAQAKEEFEHAVIDKELKMEVVDITSDHVHVVNLSKEGNGSIVPCIDIKDILLQTGFVSEGPSVMQKVSHGLPILRRKDYVAITLDLCTYIGVVPTIVVSPSSFCCQLICNTREIDSLMEELHLCYTGSQPNANISWQKGIPCAALYEGDGGWYRAVVEKAKGNLAGIKYVDFGNKEIVETSSLRPLYEDFFELPAQAIPCTLECAVSHTAEWSLEAVTYFKEVCLEKQLIMFPVSQSSQNCYSVRLYDTLSKKGEHIDFEELLCSKGFLAAPFSIATTDSIEVNSLKLGKSEEVIVTTVESPYSFWCQIVGSLGLDELMDSIATTYEDGRDRLRLEKAEEGQLVCCQFTEDDGWYRARVLGTKGDKVTVCYIDYGNTETLPLDRIRMLASEFSADPSYAVHCALKNPSDGRKWNAEEQDLFRDMTLDHQFTAKLINCDNELHVISLYKEGSDISKALTKNAKKLAQFAQKFSEPEDPEINSTMDVLITYMESATTFYCQPVHNEQAANQMLEKLSEYAPQAHTLTDPKEGSICIAKFSVDDMWYRAVVRTVLQDSVRVQFVDYGNEDEVSRKDLKEVDASLLSCPKLSLYCFVKGLDGEELFEEKTYSVKITGKDCNSFEMELTISSPSPSKEVSGFASNKVYKMIEINESEDYKVYISHINSLSDFYVQLVSCNVTLDELATTLEEISNQSMNVLTQVQVDTPCICQYDEDNSWYRGKVIDINNALVTVLFVDYGNTTRVEVGNLYDIPGSLLGIPAQSIHCMLDKQANILMDDSFREKFLSLDNIELNVTFLHKQDSVWNVTLTNTELLLQSSIDFLDNGKETLISQEVPKFKSAVVDSTQDCQVFVSHVNSLSDFYVQKSSSTSDLDRISDLLSKICISDGSHLPVIGSGVPCLCAYEDDGLLYRAEVQAVAGDRATVLFVDYGNAATVNVTELREIPIHLLTDSRMAIQCRLEGLVTDDQDKGKIADFHSLVDDVELTATFVTQVEDIWDVNLEGETGCIREALFAFNEGTVEESSYVDAAIVVESDAGEEVDKEDEENFEDETVMETDATHQVCFEEDENFADEMIMNTDIAEQVDVADVENFEGDAVMEIGVEGKVCFEEEENLVGDASDQRASEFSLVSNAKCLATAPLAEGTSHVVYVSHVNSITDFYVQLSSSTGTLEDLESELAKHCGDSLAALTEVQVGCCCVCKFVEDGLWHRAEVQEVSGQTVKVLFVDYGNSSTVDASELREISDHLLSESRLAIHCRLEGLTTDDQDEGKIADFHSLVDDVELTATFLTQVEDIWDVSLEGEKGCIREALFAFNEGTVEESSYVDAAIVVESDAGEEVDKEDEENFEDETVMETDATHQVCFEEDENFADEMIMNTDIAEQVDVADVENFEGDAVMEIGVEGKVCFEEEENLVGDASDQRASEFSLVSNAKCLATAPLAEGTSHVVYVSHVNSITDFYVQLSSSTGTLEDLESELAKHCGDSLAALTEVQVGCCCVCKFVEDGLWHRAEVQEVSGQTVKVLFVDYGNSSTVDASELREISDHLLSESRLAIHCRLEGLTTDDQDEGKIADFHSLVDDVELTATFLTQVEDIWDVSLEGEKGCIREALFAFNEGTVEESSYVDAAIVVESDAGEEVDKEDEENFEDETVMETDATHQVCFEEDENFADEMIMNTDIAEQVDVADVENFEGDAVMEIGVEGKVCFEEEENLVGDASDQRASEFSLVSNAKCLATAPLAEGTSHVVYVSHVNSITDFYVQLSSSTGTLEDLESELAKHCGDSLAALTEVQVGCCCVCKFVEDGLWHRAEVQEVSGQTVKVLFVDYGNSSTVDASELREISDHLLSESRLAIHCRLEGLTTDDQDEGKIADFHSLVDDVELTATFLTQVEDIWNVSLEGFVGCLRGYLFETASEDVKAEDVKATPKSYGIKAEVRGKHDVVISNILCNGWLYLNLKSDLDTISEISNALGSALDREKFPLSPVIVGMPCCIFFESTKKWVRGRVHELHASTVVTVMAVDTGVTQEFASSAIFALPDEFLEVTPLALPCCFAGNECMRGNLKASSGLRYLIERKVLLTADFLCVDKNVYQVRTFLQEQLYDPALLKTCMDFRSSLDFMAHTNELLQDLKPKREALLKVQIASISHPDDFVCHPSQCVTVLENITSLLLSFVDSKPLCRGKVDRDSVIAFDQVYSKWARGQVLNFGKARALVSFIDLGHQAWIEYSALRLLPFEFLEIPKLALTCKLHNLKPCSRTWTNGAIDYLKSLSRSKKWFTCMIHNDQGGKLEVDLITEDDVNVGSKLVELGLALRDAAEIKNRPEDEEKPPGHYFGVSEDSLSQASFIVCKAFDTVANIKGVISSVFAVDDIWIQPTENKTKLDDIATAITNHSQKFEELSIEPAENLPCLAFSTGDNQWYRAKIEAVVNDSVTALLVDVGEKMDVKIFNLRPIPTELFAIPPLCFRVALHAPLLEPEILTDILHYIQSVHVGQEVDIELESRSDHYFSVKLFWNGRDIVDSFFANRISLHGGAAAEILTVPDEEVDISSEVVFLSHLNSLDDLFFQRVSDTDRLETLTRDLNTLPESSLNFLERITSGTHCLAPVGDGGSFCRVEVTDVVGDVASVHLLDYGKDREVNSTCLRPLPPTFFSQPKCCIHCKLVGWEEKLEDTEAYRLWLLNNANNYELKLSSVGMQGNKRVVHLFCNGDPFTEVFMRSQRVDHVVNEKGFSKNGARFVDHDILTDIITPVRVLSVNDDLSFTCELVEMTDPLKTLVDQIQDHCDNDLTEKIEWVQDTPCLALFPECSLWHRAIVNECKGEFASVYFVDCGKKCSVPVAYLRHIPSKFTYLACASIHCTFDVDLNNIDTESGLAWFTEKCLDQNGTLNVVTKDENRFVVRLYVGKEDIAESLRSKFLKDPEAQVTEERARKFETRQAVCEEEQQFITEPTGVLSGKNDPASKEENSDMSVVTLDCSLKQSDENKDPCVDSKINGDISTVRNAIICGSEAAGELSEITESIVEDDAITERPAVTELAGQPSCSEDRIIPRTNSSAKFLPASKEPGYKLTAPLSCSMSRDTSSDEAGAFAKVFKRPFHSGESIDLKISVVISPSNFWCQFVDTQDDLDGMTKAIADYCQNGKALFLAEEARIGFHYLAPFIEENKWYRCEVVKMTDDCKDVFVRYVDFGHCAQLPLEKLKLLPPNFCKLPAQALSCSLFGISGSENGSWSFQAISRFEELCGNNNLNCIIMRVRESTEVLVEGQKESVNDTLVLEGFAVVDEDDE